MAVLQNNTCPACGTISSSIFALDECTVYHCANCTHEFSITNSDTVNIYNENYFLEDHANWFANPDLALYAKLADIITQHGGKTQNVIDIGCGTGNFLTFLKTHGFSNLHGLDVINHNIEGISFITSRIEDFKPNTTYDTVVSLANIEHIMNIQEYAQCLKSITRRGSLLIIYTVDCKSLLYNISKALYKIGIAFPSKRLYSSHHLNHFSVNSLSQLIQGASFSPMRLWKTSIPRKAQDLGEGLKRLVLLSGIIPIEYLAKALDSEMLQVALFTRK